MSLGPVTVLLLGFVGFYPVVTSAIWLAGALIYRVFDEPADAEPPPGGWPGVTVLVPAYNEQRVIARCIEAARQLDYPSLEVLVLDDGSTDETAGAAEAAAGGDPRVEVVADPVNRGKAERLNRGLERARHGLVVVTDADTHIHPLAVKLLVARLNRSEKVGAVAGAPHVTNRRSVLAWAQIIELASIVGLIRRTQAISGRVGVVAGVIGIFRRDAVLAVGGYQPEMATEDIDLTWRLLLAGWHTSYEPNALVGMEVPSTLHSLWIQRRRWARGLGEVLHVHAREIIRWRHRHLWPLLLEGLASLAWVVLLATFYVAFVAVLLITDGTGPGVDGFLLFFAWGIALCLVSTLQLTFALRLDYPHDPRALFALLVAPIYPVAHWLVAALAALRDELPALFRGPAERRVVWDVPREEVSDVVDQGSGR